MIAPARTRTATDPSSGLAELAASLARVAGIGLETLGEDSLQDRLDTKYLLDLQELPGLIDALASAYRVLEIKGVRLLGYQTVYFDTPGFALYLAQHNGRPDRYKVRSRRYVETRQSFLEVKHKNVLARTVKNRVPTGELLTSLDEAARAFVARHVPFPLDGLEPKLWNRFSRITLVRRDAPERITLDVDLGFGRELIRDGLPGVAVAEMKQERLDRDSPFLREMRRLGAHPSGFSKYCIGVALLNPDLKHNRFRPELLRARRISERYLKAYE